MKKLFFYAITLASVLAVSCQKESKEVNVATKSRTVTLSASMDAFKTSYADDKTFSWVAGDAISVMVSNGEETKAVEFTTEQTGATASFTGTVEEGYEFTGKAFYPASLSPKDSIGTYVVNLPNNITDTENPLSSVPLVGDIDGTSVKFHTAVGVMKFTVKNIPEQAYFFTLYSAVPVAGRFLVSEDGYIKMDDAVKASRMLYSYFEGESEQTFYFPVPVGTLPVEGYEITVETFGEYAIVDKLGSVDIEIAPNSLTVINPITCPEYESPYTLVEDWTAEYEAEDDLITFNCDAPYYYWDIVSKEDFEEYGADTWVEYYSSAIEGFVSDDGLDVLVEYEYLLDSTPYLSILGSWFKEPLDPGDYVVLLIGFDEEGNATGEYGASVITIPGSAKSAPQIKSQGTGVRKMLRRPAQQLPSHSMKEMF